MTYGDIIRSMNDKDLAEFLRNCVIPDNENKLILDLINSLEQQPSDDCVSRADLLAQINESWETIETKLDFVNIVKALPSVTSKVPTLDDCVSREQALLALTGINLHLMNAEELIVLFDKRIKALPPVTPTQRWIPVSERLPNSDIECLVTDEDGECGVGYYCENANAWDSPNWGWLERKDRVDNKEAFTEPCGIGKVIAWMPLPQPYEEKRGNSDGR